MARRHTLFVACMSMLFPVAAAVAPVSAAQAGTASDEILRATLVNDAVCLVQYERPRVNSFLKQAAGTSRLDAQSRLLGNSACMKEDRLSYQPGQLRGALFIALYQSQYGMGEAGLWTPRRTRRPGRDPPMPAPLPFSSSPPAPCGPIRGMPARS